MSKYTVEDFEGIEVGQGAGRSLWLRCADQEPGTKNTTMFINSVGARFPLRTLIDFGMVPVRAGFVPVPDACTFETADDFLEAEFPDQLLIESSNRELWLSWETPDGERYAIRSRYEDDPEGPAGDRWRPIGPVDVERLDFPITVRDARDALGRA